MRAGALDPQQRQQANRMSAGRGNRDLLAEDCPDRQLEGIPATGHPSSGLLRNCICKQRVGRESRTHRVDRRLEVEQTLASPNQIRHRERPPALDLHEHAVGYESEGHRSFTVVTAPGTANRLPSTSSKCSTALITRTEEQEARREGHGRGQKCPHAGARPHPRLQDRHRSPGAAAAMSSIRTADASLRSARALRDAARLARSAPGVNPAASTATLRRR